MPAQKVCLDCRSEKPLELFPVRSRRSDGRGSYCTACMLVRSRASYRKRRTAEGRAARERPPSAPEGHKRCPDCDQVLAHTAFPRNKASRDGLASYCKPCHNARTHAARERAGGSRDYHLRRRYGITEAEYDALVAAQGGVCAVCQERPPGHVDHDHRTGAVRGVLCSGCNQGLGNFRDSADAMRRGADYIERTS